MRRKLIVVLAAAVVLSIIIWFRPFYVVPILNYHSVSPTKFTNTPIVSPEVFAKQMEFIYKKGYQVISLDDYIKQRQAGKRLINTAVITFDDGYDDNYNYAFPILKKYHFPATIFLIANYKDNYRFLKINQIREMEKEGINFGSHTLNHAYLPGVKDMEKLNIEITNSKQVLERRLGHAVDYFSYPIGGFNKGIEELVKLAGYKAATTTNRGRGNLNSDIYALQRIKVSQKDLPSFVFWLKLSGYYLLFQDNKEPY